MLERSHEDVFFKSVPNQFQTFSRLGLAKSFWTWFEFMCFTWRHKSIGFNFKSIWKCHVNRVIDPSLFPIKRINGNGINQKKPWLLWQNNSRDLFFCLNRQHQYYFKVSRISHIVFGRFKIPTQIFQTYINNELLLWYILTSVKTKCKYQYLLLSLQKLKKYKDNFCIRPDFKHFFKNKSDNLTIKLMGQ